MLSRSSFYIPRSKLNASGISIEDVKTLIVIYRLPLSPSQKQTGASQPVPLNCLFLLESRDFVDLLVAHTYRRARREKRAEI